MSEARPLPVDFRAAWQRRDPAIEADAVGLWKRLNALPVHVDMQQRASELCLAAYRGAELIGVSTAVVRELPALRNRFAFFRCIVDPQHRGFVVAGGLLENSFRLLSDWSHANRPARVMGMAAIQENRNIRLPVVRGGGCRLALVGYTTAGAQIRVAWFSHAVVD